MRTVKILTIAAGMLILSGSVLGVDKIGILCQGEPQGDTASLVNWSKMQGYKVEILSPWPNGQFKKPGIDIWVPLSEYKLLWLDVSKEIAVDKDPGKLPDAWIDEACRKSILDYIKNGGVLVVSTLAMKYPVELGIEKTAPNEWGQFGGVGGLGAATIGWKGTEKSELFEAGSVVLTGEGTHLFRWMRYAKGAMPANGKVLATNHSDAQYKEVVRWDVGKGRIYGLPAIPWLTDDNPKAAAVGDIVKRLYAVAEISPDSEIAKQAIAEAKAVADMKERQTFENLKLSNVSQSVAAGKQRSMGAYAELTKDGFVIGNDSVERRIVLLPNVHTVSIWNKDANEAIAMGSAEFRITFGKEKQQLNLSNADFKLVGKPKLVQADGSSKVDLTFERRESPSLKVVLTYTASNAPELEKSLLLTNISGSELFLREVWLDTLRFEEKVEVVPYPVFSAFARTKAGSVWLCQSLPYSLPSTDTAKKWIAVAYPPCEPLAAGAMYQSENSYLTAVGLSGKMYIPSEVLYHIDHQITSYGPIPDVEISLDEAEIESCLDFVDRYSTQISVPLNCYFSYHDYGMLGTTDFLPYVKGEGGGFENIKKWLDRANDYGVETYCIYPDLGAWQNTSAADVMLTKQILPFLKQKEMNLLMWFSVYSPSWYSGVGLLDGKVISTYLDKDVQNKLVNLLKEKIGRYGLAGIFPDQAAILVDKSYDASFGYPGTPPLSPFFYKEYKSWDSMLKCIRKKYPNIHWGGGHFGNNQSPLFCGINSMIYWCEGAEQHHKQTWNRQPATSEIKAFNDAYRREMYWYNRERFTPYRLMMGNVDYQISTSKPVKPAGEPIAQHFRYLVLQNLAMHANAAHWGFQAMTAAGFYGEKEKRFSRKWMGFMETYTAALSNRPYTPSGEPKYGVVEVYSYGDKGDGFVFLVNPQMLAATATLTLDNSIGFEGNGNYAVREMSPYDRWLLFDGKPYLESGQKFSIKVPAFAVTVLQIKPVQDAWKGQKQIIAGAEIMADGKLLATAGERIDAAKFNVADPQKPEHLQTISGIAAGTAPRIDITKFLVKSGLSDAPMANGFTDGTLVGFKQSSDISKEFALTNFAGIAIWDMDRDFVNDRIAVDASKLGKADSKTEKALCVSEYKAVDAQGYWLCTDYESTYIPANCTIILQTGSPEKAVIKLWINGIEQDCGRSFNDWAVLKPGGLKIGINRLVVWLAKRN